jgi:hypothetical protein
MAARACPLIEDNFLVHRSPYQRPNWHVALMTPVDRGWLVASLQIAYVAEWRYSSRRAVSPAFAIERANCCRLRGVATLDAIPASL